jgi:hypothetical protein
MAATIPRYRLTDDGPAFAIFDTTVHNRVLKPLLATTAAATIARSGTHHRPAHQRQPQRRRPTVGVRLTL